MTWQGVAYGIGILAVVVAAQWGGCVTFNEDELKRIIYTLLGWGGIAAFRSVAGK